LRFGIIEKSWWVIGSYECAKSKGRKAGKWKEVAFRGNDRKKAMNRVQGRKEGEKWKNGSAANSGGKKA